MQLSNQCQLKVFNQPDVSPFRKPLHKGSDFTEPFQNTFDKKHLQGCLKILQDLTTLLSKASRYSSCNLGPIFRSISCTYLRADLSSVRSELSLSQQTQSVSVLATLPSAAERRVWYRSASSSALASPSSCSSSGISRPRHSVCTVMVNKVGPRLRELVLWTLGLGITQPSIRSLNHP